MAKRLVALAIFLLLPGCAVGPDFERPPAPADNALGPLSAGHGEIKAAWWQLYRSPVLDRLIADALAHNADLAAAQAALRVAHEVAAANEGVFYPNLQGGFQALRQKDPTGAVQPTSASGNPQLTLFTPQLSVSYAPDLWGGNRRAQESLGAQSRAQEFQLEATYQLLAANVVVAAIGEANLNAQVTAAKRNVELEQESLAILKRQLSLGQVAETALLTQETALAQAEQALRQFERQWDQQRHQLTALLGRLPADEPAERLALDDLHPPTDLPAVLPSKLVEQRPDIRIAEANLQAASAQIGVAIANRLPNIGLEAALGSSATSWSSLFSPGDGFWSLGGNLTEPLFDGFSLLHKERAARAAYDQAAAQYRSTVITAFQNVADSLQALQTDADSLQAAVAADQAAARMLTIAGRQLELGDIGPLALMTAEQAALQAGMARAQAQANCLTDTAALLQALGGGWWTRGAAERESLVGQNG